MNNSKVKHSVINYLYNTIYQILKILLPIITVPYVSRVLGKENLGIHTYTHSVALYFAMFAYLGFENYGTRLIAGCKGDKEAMNREFTSAYAFQVLSSVLAIIAYGLYVLVWSRENTTIAWIQIMFVITELFNVSWLYFGLEMFKVTAIRSVVIRLLSAAAIFMFVKTPDDLPLYSIIVSASMLIGSLVLWVGIGRYVKIVKVSWKDIAKHVKGCLILFFPVLVISVYRTMDKIMLGNISTMSQVAIYNNADKIVELPYGIIASLGVVMLPRMTAMVARGEESMSKKYIEVSMRFMLVCACGMAFGLFGIGKVFAPVFFGNDFIACGQLIMIISPMIIIRACANVVRTQYLLPNRRDKDYIVSILIGVVINLVLNALLIPRYGADGAAVATLFCESFVAVYQVVACRRAIPVTKYIFRNWYFLLAGAIMSIPVYLYGMKHAPSVKVLAVQVAMGVVIYMIAVLPYLMHSEKELIKKILKR